eukprot:SAG11_NODE_14870_length_597_cov_0.819277_1_plen_80_part_00
MCTKIEALALAVEYTVGLHGAHPEAALMLDVLELTLSAAPQLVRTTLFPLTPRVECTACVQERWLGWSGVILPQHYGWL